MPLAFFSYAHLDWDAPADRANVRALVGGLGPQVRAAMGDKTFEVWRDEQNLRWGDDWRDNLGEVLDRAELLIVLVSPAWLKSDVCAEEYEHFKKKQPDSGRILPISMRQINQRHLDRVTKAQKKRYSDLRKIQHRLWQDLPSLDDRGLDMLLADTAQALADRLLEFDPAKQQLQTVDTVSPVVTPIDVQIIPPVSGDYYIPSQARDTCQLKLAASGLAMAETEYGTVVFAIRSMIVRTNLEGGRIVEENPKFAAPWNGPVATVVRGETTAHQSSLVVNSRDNIVMQGEPLSGGGDVGHVHLFNIEADDDACVEVNGIVSIQRHAIRIEETQSDLEPTQEESRQVMLKRLTDILLRDHIESKIKLEGARYDRSTGG